MTDLRNAFHRARVEFARAHLELEALDPDNLGHANTVMRMHMRRKRQIIGVAIQRAENLVKTGHATAALRHLEGVV
jgi:hypothetical protein